MAAGTTGTAELTNSLQEILTIEAQFEAARTQVFGQFPMVPADGAISGPDAGQTVKMRFLPRLPLKTDTINEKADITPRKVGDEYVDITINEYGDAVQITKFAEIVTKGDLRSETGRRVAEQMVASLDRLAGRQYYEGQNFVFRANGVSARSGLDAANDTLADTTVGHSFLERLQTALQDGLLKIMSKMGISTARGYQGAQLFTPVGLGPELMARYFPGHTSVIGGLELEDLAAQILDATEDAPPGPLPSPHLLREHNKGDGERHSMTSAASRLVAVMVP